MNKMTYIKMLRVFQLVWDFQSLFVVSPFKGRLSFGVWEGRSGKWLAFGFLADLSPRIKDER